MACCGKGKKGGTTLTIKEVGGREFYSRSNDESNELIAMDVYDSEKNEVVGEKEMTKRQITNYFRMYFETEAKGYRKVKNVSKFFIFKEGSKFGLCKNLCVTNKPSLTVSKEFKIIEIPKTETKKEEIKEE